jgi:hypothetical protein
MSKEKSEKNEKAVRCHRFSPVTLAWLGEVARDHQISEAELVRRCVDEYRERHPNLAPSRAKRRTT